VYGEASDVRFVDRIQVSIVCIDRLVFIGYTWDHPSAAMIRAKRREGVQHREGKQGDMVKKLITIANGGRA
jgi:hypothetical protein